MGAVRVLSVWLRTSNMLRAFQRFLWASRRAKPDCRRSCRVVTLVPPLVMVRAITFLPRKVRLSLILAAKPAVVRKLSLVVLPRHSVRTLAFQFSEAAYSSAPPRRRAVVVS